MPRFPLLEWQSEQLRLTLFPALGATAPSPESWEQFAGGAPDQTVTNPKQGTSTITGQFGLGKLALRLSTERIDWLFQPTDLDPENAAAEFPSIGPMLEAWSIFAERAEDWLHRDDIPDTERLAFGAVLLHPEEDRDSAYSRLPHYVPVQVQPGSSDFLYQINRPVPSGTAEGLVLNRLSKWGVANIKRFAFKLSAVGVGAPIRQALTEAPGVFALRLELDLSTNPTTSLLRTQLGSVFRELVALGRRIAEDGIQQ